MYSNKKAETVLKTTEPKLSYWKILKEFTKLFFDVSSIHGFPQISQKGRHVIERIIWVCLVAAAIYGAGILSHLTLTRYRNNPIVTSMERDRFNWNTTFVPATICIEKKIDLQRLDDYLIKNDSIKNKTTFRNFVLSLATATYLNLDTVVEYEGIPGEDFAKLLRKFTFQFKVVTSFNNNDYDSFITFDQILTEMGICYTFNSQLAMYNYLQYRKNGSTKFLPKKSLLFVNPVDAETFINIINITSGYQLYFHGPFETVDIVSKSLRLHENGNFMVYISALELFASDRTKSFSPEQRKCRFYYESDLPHFPVYSYVLCRMECRANLANRLCGCVPHFYKALEGEKICDVKGLHCLSKHKENLIFLKDHCTCTANCDETFYVVDDFKEYVAFVGSSMSWGFKQYPKMRLKRDVIFGFSDLLVSIGGMAGLFLGCSILSFIEIFYFFTLRLFWFVVKYKCNKTINK